MLKYFKRIFRKGVPSIPFTPPCPAGKQSSISSLRQELLYWGVDTSHLTDEQLEENILTLNKCVRASGVTMEDAAKVLLRGLGSLWGEG